MTSKTVKILAMTAFCTVLGAWPAHAQRTIGVTGPDGYVTIVNLAEFPRHTVITGDRGRKATFEGVALRDVLAKAGVALGEELRGKALARAILVTATDGYQAVYAITEVDAAFTDQIILLADRRDDLPLLPDTGPAQLVVPLDKRPARWVRQVAKIEVRDVK